MKQVFAIKQGGTTATSAASINLSAGSTSINSNAFTFSNSNGVTFGIDTNAVITASVQTNYQSPGAYLTTAMASNRGSDFVQATAVFHGTNASGTIASGNISVSVAAQSAQSFNISAGTTSSNVTAVTFSNGSGVSFGFDGSNITATVATNYQSQGAYLTTAMQSNAATISNIKISAGASSSNVSAVTFSNANGVSFGYDGTNVTATVQTLYVGTNFAIQTTAGTDPNGILDTLGMTFFYPKWITTYVNDLTSGRAGTNISRATVAGTDLTLSVNTSGVSIGYPKWITTAAATNITTNNMGLNTSVATTAGTDLAMTGNTSGLTIGYPKWITTADLSQNSSLYAGTGFTTATTAGANIVGTLNTSGLSLGVPAYLTTAAQSSAMLSYWANMGALLNTFTTMCQSNTFYVFPLTVGNNVSASYLRLLASFNFTSTSIATSAVNNATGASTAFSETVAFNAVLYTVGAGSNSLSLQEVSSASAGLTWAVSVSQASTSNASRQSITQIITFPALGFTTATTSIQYSVSATNGPISTTQWSNLSSNRFLDIPWLSSISAGNYWLALNRISGTVGSKSMDVNASTYGVSQYNSTWVNLAEVSNLSNAAPQFGLGQWTTNIAQTTGSIGLGSVSGIFSFMLPMVQFIRQA